MTYREQLNKVNELGISICDLAIANELDCVLEFEFTDCEFELLCNYAKEIYLKADDLTEYAIARTINDLLHLYNTTSKIGKEF